MKKPILIVFITFIIIFTLTGCMNSSTEQVSNTITGAVATQTQFPITVSEPTPSIQATETINDSAPTMQAKGTSSKPDNINAIVNPFFFPNNKTEFTYNCIFDDFYFPNNDQQSDSDNGLVKCDMINMGNYKGGTLYNLKFDTGNIDVGNRLDLGYFFVTEDQIYRFVSTDGNVVSFEGTKQPQGSVLVCQNKEKKDTLKKDEKGWHQYIDVNGNTREYHSYDSSVETGFYEDFFWEKNCGLVYYVSGWGAEREQIELNLIKN